MQDPHPLAIIPLQKNLLPSDTSSSSSVGSSPNSSTPGGNAPLVPIRALVAHKGTAAAGLNESLRSEDDAALMRSLISLLPHERADSQVPVFFFSLPPRFHDASEFTRSVIGAQHVCERVPHFTYIRIYLPKVYRSMFAPRAPVFSSLSSPAPPRPAPMTHT